MLVRNEIKRAGGIERFARELIDQAMVSRETRREAARYWRQMYYHGSQNLPAKQNLCYDHVDKLGSLLFSPSEVRFTVSFESDEAPQWTTAADQSSRYINRQFYHRNCDLAFAQGVDAGLIEGSCFIKLAWGRGGYVPHVISQQFMGVQREDQNSFEQQDFFVHSYYNTPDQVRRLIAGYRNERELLIRLAASFTEGGSREAEVIDDSYFHEIVTGGINPVGNSNSQSSVRVFGNPAPMLSPAVAAKLARVDDIWIFNDLAWPLGTYEEGGTPPGDWNLIRYVDPGIILDGDAQLTNPSGIPGEHPFIKVCPGEVRNYFWGRSELAVVAGQQEWLNARIDNVDDIFALRARPPRSFTGFSGLTPEKMRALLTRGGTLTDDSPTGKVESHAPEMPPEALEYINLIKASFDEAAGMTPIMSGQGESGVRAGVHANTLLRTSTPRMRDRATVVEKQCGAFGQLCFEMSRAKDPRVFITPDGKSFTLEQLPEDATVTVDSHTSSPAFSGDNMQLAFALAKAQAIDGESLIRMTHPPGEDELVLKYREAQKQKQQLIQQHPELLMKGAGHRK